LAFCSIGCSARARGLAPVGGEATGRVAVIDRLRGQPGWRVPSIAATAIVLGADRHLSERKTSASDSHGGADLLLSRMQRSRGRPGAGRG
jgi:hypothetical protein